MPPLFIEVSIICPWAHTYDSMVDGKKRSVSHGRPILLDHDQNIHPH
jgi:hypothetical protein